MQNEDIQLKLTDLQNQINNLPIQNKQKFSNTTINTTETVVQRGGIQSAEFLTGATGWRFDADGNLEANAGHFRGDVTGASGTFSGVLTGGSLNIPDITSAPSFHVDSTGNTWWGAAAIGSAVAKILNTGALTATGVTIAGALTTSAGSSINGSYLTLASVTGGAIAAATITASNITNATITGTQIASATITGSNIAATTITASNITNATITATQIANATITTTQISGTAAITGTQIASATITGSNIALVTVAAGNIISGTITATQIASATITGGNIANATITGTQIAATTIAAGNIVSGTITSTQIASATIVAGNIANATITGTQISATAGIVGGQIAATTITGGNIAATTITGSNITNLTITAGQIANLTITSGKVNTALMSYSHNIVFSFTGDTQVNWASGTLTTSDGTAYTISAGNTGVMSAKNYIYLDTAVSVTVLQKTTTFSTAVGDGKMLIAVAQNNTTEAVFQVFNGIGGTNLAGGSIVAGSITANEIAANTITASQIAANTITASQIAAGTITATEMTVAQLSSISADMGTITAGTITVDSAGYIRGGQTDFNTGIGWWKGYSGGAYKSSIGDPDGDHLNWDGARLVLHGSFNVGNSGLINNAVYTVANLPVAPTSVGFNVPSATDANYSPEIIDSYSESNESLAQPIGGSSLKYLGQSFSNTDIIMLDSCKFYIEKTGLPTGNIVAQLYAHTETFGSNGKPTGAVLATSDNYDISTLTTSLALITFNFTGANRINLSASTKYVIVLYYDGGSSDSLLIGLDNTSTAASGNWCYSANGSTWTGSSGVDLCFYVYGLPLNFTSPANIYASDNTYATLAATSGVLTVEVSKDAGVNWQTPKTVTFTGSDTLQTVGNGSTELFGSSFTRADVVDAKLFIRLSHGNISQVYKTFGFSTGSDILTGIEIAIEGNYASSTLSLDLLEVKIYYGTSVLPVQAGSQAFDSTNGTLGIYDGNIWQDLATTNSINNSLYRQAIINGNFDVWQRGTSFTGVTPYYSSDRWQAFRAGAVAGSTYSRQVPSLNGSNYNIRCQRDSGNTSTNGLILAQSIESNNSITFVGQKVTLSFYARCGANYSPTSSLLITNIVSGTGTDENLSNGFTGSATVGISNVTLTTSWQKFTITTTNVLASTVKQLGVSFTNNPTGTAGANDYFEIAQVQLNAGSVALPFMPKSFADELRDCQRYYETSWDYGVTATSFGTEGRYVMPMSSIAAASVVRGGITFKVKKRITAPTIHPYSSVTRVIDTAHCYDGGDRQVSASISEAGMANCRIELTTPNNAGAATSFISYHWSVEAEL